MVTSFAVYRVFTFQNEPINNGISKYNTNDISDMLRNNPDAIESALQTIKKSDNESYEFDLDICENSIIILHMSDKALNKNDSNRYEYDCFFNAESLFMGKGNPGKLFYIYSEQGNTSYRIFIKDEDVVFVQVGGKTISTYNYGDKQITNEYYDILEKAKKCSSEINKDDLYSYRAFFKKTESVY